MKPSLIAGFVAATGLLGSGCASEQHTVTNPHHPGPAVGQALGKGVGVVAGNVAGTVVGAGEGLVQGTAAPFCNTTRKVRVWRTEVTSDGRTIQVPQDIEVDQYGRPLK
jgi:hypothetical protein